MENLDLSDKKKLFSLFENFSKEELEKVSKPTTINSHTLIIDGTNTFIRVWSVLPTMNNDGDHVGGIVGFLKSIGYCIRMIKPTRCIIVFDGKGGSQKRKKIYPEYKKQRSSRIRVNRIYSDIVTPDLEDRSIKQQFLKIVEYLDCLPVTIICMDNIEADDVIGYTSKQILNKEDEKITIMSADKDFLQLVDDRIKVWSPTKKKFYGKLEILEEYGINSENFIYYRAMDGDISDNINGIPGAGLKTLKKAFPMLNEDKKINENDLLTFAKDNNNSYKIYSSLLNNEDVFKRNIQLMQLENPDINGTTKLKLIDMINSNVNELNKFQFSQKLTRDKMHNAIPNYHVWLIECFGILDNFARNFKK
jgi:5'-3' exonuclease